MIKFVSYNSVTPFASMDDVISFKIYTYDELGLNLMTIKYLNEMGVATDEGFGTYHNRLTIKPSDYEKGVLNVSEMVKDLSRIPADVPEVMKEMIDSLVKKCMSVINSGEDIYLA